MTADEFIKGYAERSGVTIEWLYEHGRVVVNCGPDQRCGEPDCPGWALVSREAFERDGEFYNWTLALPLASIDSPKETG